MSRPIWKGHVSFGLVNVPVILMAAERRVDLSFRMFDAARDIEIFKEGHEIRLYDPARPCLVRRLPDRMNSSS